MKRQVQASYVAPVKIHQSVLEPFDFVWSVYCIVCGCLRFPLQEHNVELPITKPTKLDFQRRLAKRTDELPHNGAQSVHARLQTCNATVSYIRCPFRKNLIPLYHVLQTYWTHWTMEMFRRRWHHVAKLFLWMSIPRRKILRSSLALCQYDTQSNCTGCCALLCPISCHRCNRSCNGRTWKCRRWKCRQMPLQETRNLLSRCAPRFAL